MGLLKNNISGGTPNFSGFNGGFKQGINATNSLINSGERGYDRHRKNQALDAMGKAWASGDPAQLDAAMKAFPEYIGQMQKQMGIRDDQHRKDLGSMTAKLHGLLNAGDTEGAKALVQQNPSLFDKEGPYSAQGVADMIDSGDQKKLKYLDSWAQSTTLGSLTPLEIMKEGDAQQRFGLDRDRMNLNDLFRRDRLSHEDSWRELAHEDRMQRLQSMDSWHSMTPAMRNYAYAMSLPPDQRADFMKLGGGRFGSGDGNFEEIQTPDGKTHRIPINPHTGGYAHKDTKGNPIDEDGKVLNLTGNAGMQSGGADALRAIDNGNTLKKDKDFTEMGGNGITSRYYREMDPTGKYHDLQTKFDTMNNAAASAIAVRVAQESNGAPRQAEIEAAVKSAGKLSTNNSYEENKAILDRQLGILHNVADNAKRNEVTGNTGNADTQHGGKSASSMSDQELKEGLK